MYYFPMQNTVASSGESILTTVTERIALPNDGSGNQARYILLTATIGSHFSYRLGDSSVTVDETKDSVLTDDHPFQVVNTMGHTHISVRNNAGGTEIIGITPLENQ